MTEKQHNEIRKTIIEINELVRIGNNLNLDVMSNIFGKELGLHFADKFVNHCTRNLFKFISEVLDETNRQKFLREVLHNKNRIDRSEGFFFDGLNPIFAPQEFRRPKYE